MFPFPAFPSARTRSKKTFVPSGAKTASTSPLKPLRMVLANGLLLGDGAVLAEERGHLAGVLGGTGSRTARAH